MSRGTAQPSPWIGRGEDLAALHRMLDSGVGLVTIVGAGGIGKTRLALELIDARARAESRVPVFFCDLQSARDAADVAASVARALGLDVETTDLIERVAEALARRGPTILVLDNFEQIVSIAPDTIGVWLARTMSVKFLVTSREPLGIAGEQQYPLASLSPPAAVELFYARARLATGRAFGSDLEPSVRRIVDLIERAPLAIEIVAARATPSTLSRMTMDLGNTLELPADGENIAERHRSIRATIDWSVGLLDERERSALTALAIFRDGFDLDLAARVIGLDVPGEVEALVGRLVHKSLIVRQGTKSRASLRLLTPVRLRLLEAHTPELRAVIGARHAAAMSALAREIGSRIESADARAALELYDHNVANFQVARDFYNLSGDTARALEIDADLMLAVSTRGGLIAQRNRILMSLDSNVELAPLVRAKAMLALAQAERLVVGNANAAATAAKAAALALEIDEPGIAAFAETQIAGLSIPAWESEKTARHAARAVELATKGKRPFVLLQAHLVAGFAAIQRGDRFAALDALDAAHAIQGGSPGWLRQTSLSLLEAEVAGFVGDLDGVTAGFERAVAAADALGDRRMSANARLYLGMACFETRDFVRAESLLTEARTVLRELGSAAEKAADWQLAILALIKRDLRAAAGHLAQSRRIDRGHVALVEEHWCVLVDGLMVALRGDYTQARATIARAPSAARSQTAPFRGGALELAQALVDLIEGSARKTATDEKRVIDAASRISAALTATQHRNTDTWGWGLRALAASLLEQIGVSAVGSHNTILELRAEATSFLLGGGQRVDLSKQPLLRRILLRLAEAHSSGEGDVDFAALAAAGWPNGIDETRRDRRVQAAVGALRRLGLNDVIESVEKGYRVRPSVVVRRR